MVHVFSDYTRLPASLSTILLWSIVRDTNPKYYAALNNEYLAPAFHFSMDTCDSGEVYNMIIRGGNEGGLDGIDVWSTNIWIHDVEVTNKDECVTVKVKTENFITMPLSNMYSRALPATFSSKTFTATGAVDAPWDLLEPTLPSLTLFIPMSIPQSLTR